MIKRPLYSNFARSTLASGISDTDTTMSVKVGEETRFPQPVREGDYFPVLIQKPDYSYEIVHCTDRTDEDLTIERGKEGTSALSFSAGAVVMNVLTADTLAFYLNSYWAREEETPTQVDDSSFTLPGDKTDRFHKNRAVYLFQDSSGPGYVDSVAYDSDSDETTITVMNINVDSGLVGVDFGQDKRSAPRYTVDVVGEVSTQNSDYTVGPAAGEYIHADTSDGAITITLPSSPSDGDFVGIRDKASTFGDNNLTLDGNGKNILGDSTFTFDVTDQPVEFEFNADRDEWIIARR